METGDIENGQDLKHLLPQFMSADVFVSKSMTIHILNTYFSSTLMKWLWNIGIKCFSKQACALLLFGYYSLCFPGFSSALFFAGRSVTMTQQLRDEHSIRVSMFLLRLFSAESQFVCHFRFL